jgi:ATP-binding cassette subfamily B protein
MAIFGAIAALIMTAASVLMLGKGMGFLVERGIAEHNSHLLNEGLIIISGIILLLATGSFLRSYLVTYISDNAMASLKRDLFNHVLLLPYSYFERTKTGELISRLTSDLVLLQTVLSSSFSVALRNGIMLIGGLTMMLLTSYQLASIVAGVIVIIILPIIILGKKVKQLSKITQAKNADITSHIEETIHGIKTIQSYTYENFQQTHFNLLTEEALKASKRKIIYRSSLVAIVITFVFGAIAFVLWMGGQQVVTGRLSTGELSSFIFYAIVVAGSTGSISEIMSDLQRASGAAERIIEVLHEPTAAQVYPTPLLKKNISISEHPQINFKEVSFSYETQSQQRALHDINFIIEPGQTVALVGPSGAGKSTIFELLLRFYDPQHGSILIDNHCLTSLPLSQLRQYFGVVPQQPIIFTGSAYDNIRLGNPNASDDEILSAAKAAICHDFLMALPQGFNTFLGEKGVRLSGGERQRIAIARAFLRNPKILLLDEATSALDTANEKLVQHAFETLMENRTNLIISHRLSTILKADRIIVLDKGHIVETGTHQELINNNGLYAHLVELQFNTV